MTRFLAVGHVTRDEFPEEAGWRLGGAALYAAAAASRLGAEAALVTRVGPAERPALEERCRSLDITLHALPSEVTTSFAFRYDGTHRILRLRARARALRSSDVPERLRHADAVLLGSVAHEIDGSLLDAFPDAVVVVTAQGYLREWDAAGSIHLRRWDAEVGPHVAAIVLSDEDVGGDLSEPRRWSTTVPVVVTLAERGALVLERDGEHVVPGYTAARLIDPTGSGDAFAAGLAIALAERRELRDAARFANAVASFAVEGQGTDALADRAAVDARMSARG